MAMENRMPFLANFRETTCRARCPYRYDSKQFTYNFGSLCVFLPKNWAVFCGSMGFLIWGSTRAMTSWNSFRRYKGSGGFWSSGSGRQHCLEMLWSITLRRNLVSSCGVSASCRIHASSRREPAIESGLSQGQSQEKTIPQRKIDPENGVFFGREWSSISLCRRVVMVIWG